MCICVCRYYAICYPLQARHVHTVRRAVRLVAIFWVVSLILVGPQLAIQRLEPLIAFQQVPGSARPRLRIVDSCVEFFPDHRINVAYTMITYCVVYVLPVGVMLTAYALIARELARRYRHQRAGNRFADFPSVAMERLRKLVVQLHYDYHHHQRLHNCRGSPVPDIRHMRM